jgi:hypothetical protein
VDKGGAEHTCVHLVPKQPVATRDLSFMESPWRERPANPEKPPCKYGASCYRKQPEHRAQFSHPSGNQTTVDFRELTRDAGLIEQQAALLAGFEAKQRILSPSAQPRGNATNVLQDQGAGNKQSTFAKGFVQNFAPSRLPQVAGTPGRKLPLMLILGGSPGSGKSTFSDALVRQGDVPWTRVCQVGTTFSV